MVQEISLVNMVVSRYRFGLANLVPRPRVAQAFTGDVSLSTSCFSLCLRFYYLAFGFGMFHGGLS